MFVWRSKLTKLNRQVKVFITSAVVSAGMFTFLSQISSSEVPESKNTIFCFFLHHSAAFSTLSVLEFFFSVNSYLVGVTFDIL